MQSFLVAYDEDSSLRFSHVILYFYLKAYFLFFNCHCQTDAYKFVYYTHISGESDGVGREHPALTKDKREGLLG